MKKFLFAAVMLFNAAFATDLQSENLASLKAQCQSGDAAAGEKLLEKTCDELKTATACYNLGFLKIDGHGGFKQDMKGAMKYYEKACDLGYAAGCDELGGIYNVGEADVKADENKALKYYEKSCALGGKDGCDAVKLIKGGK